MQQTADSLDLRWSKRCKNSGRAPLQPRQLAMTKRKVCDISSSSMCLSRSSRAKNAAARVIKACTGVADADSHRVSEVYLQGDSITKGTDTEFSLKIQKLDSVKAGFRAGGYAANA